MNKWTQWKTKKSHSLSDPSPPNHQLVSPSNSEQSLDLFHLGFKLCFLSGNLKIWLSNWRTSRIIEHEPNQPLIAFIISRPFQDESCMYVSCRHPFNHWNVWAQSSLFHHFDCYKSYCGGLLQNNHSFIFGPFGYWHHRKHCFQSDISKSSGKKSKLASRFGLPSFGWLYFAVQYQTIWLSNHS